MAVSHLQGSRETLASLVLLHQPALWLVYGPEVVVVDGGGGGKLVVVLWLMSFSVIGFGDVVGVVVGCGGQS